MRNKSAIITNGARGDDKLVGGLGADLLSGGEGADTFVFTTVADSNTTSYDTINDFDDLDIIDLTALNTSYANLTFNTTTVSSITKTIIEDTTSDFKLQLIGDHVLDETDFAF